MAKTRGAPSPYDPKRYPGIVAALRRRGYTIEEIGKTLQVSSKTIYIWAAKYPDFGEAVRESADAANAMVERCLYEKMIEHTVTERKVIYDANGDVKRIEETTRIIPTDSRLLRFWLLNRAPRHWRRAPELLLAEASGEDDPLVKLLGTMTDGDEPATAGEGE